jgi:hypothetical protein
MKLLILIIYSDNDRNFSEVYNKMVNIHRCYINNFEDTTTYFIQMRELQKENVEINDDFIYVNGKETLLNIMHKTIESMDYLFNVLGCKYDYILRTNISTIVNIPKLKDYCSGLPKKNVYTGWSILNLNWLDYNSGVVDNSLFGTEYASGTCIIISQDVALHILKNKKNIRYDLVDDLSLGLYIKTYINEALKNLHKCKLHNYEEVNKIYTPEKEINKDVIIFRNRMQCCDNLYDRYADVYNMQKLKDAIYK